jgi:dTDP-4-dehydrorhamnose 3,5-epimerase
MDDSTFLIIGANGQLGTALKTKYPRAQAVDVGELNITDAASVANYDWSKVKVILNAAAYTNVDGAESAEGRVAAWKVNAIAVGYLVKAALAHNLTLVQISTEYVFDGNTSPHLENEPFSPLGVYAQSKAAGDIVVSLLPAYYIVRTSWLIGEGKNFVRTMLDLGNKGVNPTVISDDVGRPTFTSELVRAIDHLLKNHSPSGIYNVSNDGEVVSWADLTRAIFKSARLNNTVTDTTDAQYYADKPAAAPRPRNSTFDLSKIHGTGFSSHVWQDDLNDYIEKELAK